MERVQRSENLTANTLNYTAMITPLNRQRNAVDGEVWCLAQAVTHSSYSLAPARVTPS